MVDSSKYIQIGSSDYWEIYLKRVGQLVYLKRITALDYADMEEYIRENHDILSEWQQEAYNGNTELWYEEWMQDYEYPYDEYYDRDGDIEVYYDGYSDDTMIFHWNVEDYGKADLIERIMDDFTGDLDTDGFEYSHWINDAVLRQTIWEYIDECVAYIEEREEAQKPHRNAFSYYK